MFITNKNWTDKKIHANLDTRLMADTTKTSYFPIPTQKEPGHNFLRSDHFPVMDLNHAFNWFELDKESKDLFDFYSSDGKLLRFNRLVTGTSSASNKCHECIRHIVEMF